MKAGRMTSLLCLSAAFVSGALLFGTSQQVQNSELTLRDLRNDMAFERETIQVLEAEWAYLNRPDRLEAQAAALLHMNQPAAGHLLGDAGEMPMIERAILPARKPVRDLSGIDLADTPRPPSVFTSASSQSLSISSSPSFPHPKKASASAASSPDKSFDDLIHSLEARTEGGG